MRVGWGEVHLPAAQRDLLSPRGLFPVDWSYEPLRLEVIGSCGAVHLQQAVSVLAKDLEADITASITVQNHPGEAAGAQDGTSVRVVVPPLRYMHQATLDGFITCEDHQRLFDETTAHMNAYLESVRAAAPDLDLYVCGFLEPAVSPDGLFFPARTLSNLTYFVRRLNDELVAWCEQSPRTHFVDCDAVASLVGKAGVDEAALTFYSHRGPLDIEYDDNTDREHGFATVPVRDSFDIRSAAYAQAVVLEIVHRCVIRSQRARVKAVIVDLDNTLWRGLAADQTIGSFNGRPQGLIEALTILRRRGIFVAIASKNDDAYIREHWNDILYHWPEVPLTTPLSLDDFDAVRISFQPKSETVAEILTQLGVLPEHAVFIDDNPLEREAVQAAFPALRILGAELNHVRRELIHSPFTQSDIATTEDTVRAATVKQQTRLTAAQRAGSTETFLASLRLRCQITEITDLDTPEGQRAIQLINKTNQWTLNGQRTTATELTDALRSGQQLVTVLANDAHSTYGIVAAALTDPTAGVLCTMVVSCRVIGMGIDDTLLSHLINTHGPLQLDYKPTDRNRATTASLTRWLPNHHDHQPITLNTLQTPTHINVEDGHLAGVTS
jgi:FkbH-like protein